MPTETKINSRIQNKHDIEANWVNCTHIPLNGELIVYDREDQKINGSLPALPTGRTTRYSYVRYKIGDGVSTPNQLPFLSPSYNDLQDKPTITDTKVTNTLANTTKAYITGTTSATTNTGTQVFDTGVYLGTTAGTLVATKFDGTATNADKLNTDEGSTTQPVYFKNGIPVQTTYKLEKSVPSNAVFTDTHYSSMNVVGSSTATSNTTKSLTNGNVFLNSVENNVVTSSHKISGSGATTVTTDASGNIIVSSTNTTYAAAGASLGLIKSGGDVTVSDGVITVNDDSHNHIIANVDNLQTELDSKVISIYFNGNTPADVTHPYQNIYGYGFARQGNTLGQDEHSDNYYCVVDSQADLYIGKQVNNAKQATWYKAITTRNIANQSVLKAKQDEDGNTIKDTYIKKSSICWKTI